jgi:hypothetical protein
VNSGRMTSRQFWKTLIGGSCSVVLVWLLFPILLVWIPSPWHGLNWESRAYFGSAYGVLSSLFTGLAFFGVVMALIVQQKEMSDAKKDTDRKLEAITAGAQLTALSTMFNYADRLIDILVAQKIPDEASQQFLDRIERERQMWFEKHRVLHKEMVRLVTKLQAEGEQSHWPRILQVEEAIAKTNGGHRPFGPDFDEAEPKSDLSKK